jgi:hypothetical protein
MIDIMSLLAGLSQCLDATTRRQLCRMTEAMLSMTGRVTMRGIARLTDSDIAGCASMTLLSPPMLQALSSPSIGLKSYPYTS